MVLSSFHYGGKTGSSSSLVSLQSPRGGCEEMWRAKCWSLTLVCRISSLSYWTEENDPSCDIFSPWRCHASRLPPLFSRQTLLGLIRRQKKKKNPKNFIVPLSSVWGWKWLVGQFEITKTEVMLTIFSFSQFRFISILFFSHTCSKFWFKPAQRPFSNFLSLWQLCWWFSFWLSLSFSSPRFQLFPFRLYWKFDPSAPAWSLCCVSCLILGLWLLFVPLRPFHHIASPPSPAPWP